jgi:hypothetical protein
LDLRGKLEAQYDATLRAELARPGTRALPDGFPRPRLPPAMRETIAAAADLADPSALADFYCERMPRMLIDQLVRGSDAAGALLWMPIDGERAPRLRAGLRGIGEALAAEGLRADTWRDPLAGQPCAARLASETLLGSGLPMVGAYPAERDALALELEAGADAHERLDLRLSGNLVHEICHGPRRECAGPPGPWLLLEAAALHLGATAFPRHVHPEVAGESIPGVAPFVLMGGALARIFGRRALWSLNGGTGIESAFGARAGRALTVAGWQEWLRRPEPPFARDASRAVGWIKLADAARGESPIAALIDRAACLDPLAAARDLPDLLDAAAEVPWTELPWWAQGVGPGDVELARSGVRAMFQVDVIAGTFQTHPHRPSRLHLDAEACLLTRDRASHGVGPGEPPQWVVPPPLCRRLAGSGTARLSVRSGRELLARILEVA